MNRTTAWPTRCPRTTTAALDLRARAARRSPGDDATAWPAWSRDLRRPRRCGRPGPAPGTGRPRPSCRSGPRPRPAATAIALVRSVRCWLARAETSAAANAAVSPASSATAASATPTNASASRSPSASPRAARQPGGAAPAVSHRGPGRAGTRRPARSARSAGWRGSSSILRRRFFTCESTVRSYPSNSYPRTRLISSNREYTRPGTVASATRMPHSVGVRSTACAAHRHLAPRLVDDQHRRRRSW